MMAVPEATRRKEQQLGMKLGTACNILNRNLLHLLAQKCGMDVCHRCGQKIATAEEISKDHVEDWMYAEEAKRLFFDPKNIVFSHKKCNTASRRMVQRVVSENSGFRGVYYCNDSRRKKKWRAVLDYAGKVIHAGSHDTPEQAAIAYDELAVRMLGQKAMTNRSFGLIA